MMAFPDIKKALLGSAFFVFWLLALPALAGYCAMPDVGQRVTSKYVIDGDTLDLTDGRRVRLIGINAPEIARKGKTSEPYAQAARKELVRLVENAELRLLVGEESQDKYGRTLGHLFDVRGANIEAKLLRQGLGFTVAVPPNVQLLDCHLQQEQAARALRKGVWRATPVQRAAQIDAGGFRLVRGRIESVEYAGRYVWMDLNGPLTLRLPRTLVDAEDMAVWQGREVEVRGWIVDRGRVKRNQKRYMLPILEWRLVGFE